jgi:hypothetical protein
MALYCFVTLEKTHTRRCTHGDVDISLTSCSGVRERVCLARAQKLFSVLLPSLVRSVWDEPQSVYPSPTPTQRDPLSHGVSIHGWLNRRTMLTRDDRPLSPKYKALCDWGLADDIGFLHSWGYSCCFTCLFGMIIYTCIIDQAWYYYVHLDFYECFV